jgi:hypothetical protein
MHNDLITFGLAIVLIGLPCVLAFFVYEKRKPQQKGPAPKELEPGREKR